MKKIIKISACMLVVSLTLHEIAYCQLVFDRYKSSIDTAKEFDMKYYVDQKMIHIDAYSISNDNVNPAGILFKSKELSKFYNTFKDARNKYSEWKKIAIQQDVDNMRKNMPFSYKTDVYLNYGGKEIINTIKCRFQFVDSLNNGKKEFRLIFYSGIIQYIQRTSKTDGNVSYQWAVEFPTGFAAGAQFAAASAYNNRVLYQSGGVAITFTNESDIDNFLAKITPERLKQVEEAKGNIDEQNRKKKQKEKLFN